MSQQSAATLARITCVVLAAMVTNAASGMAQDRGAAALAKVPVTTASA